MKKLISSLVVAAVFDVATAAFGAETDHAWTFDASGRSGKTTAPVVVAAPVSAALVAPSWLEVLCDRLVTTGFMLIFR